MDDAATASPCSLLVRDPEENWRRGNSEEGSPGPVNDAICVTGLLTEALALHALPKKAPKATGVLGTG